MPGALVMQGQDGGLTGTVRAGLMQGQRVTQETATTASLASFLASAKRQEPFDCDKKIGTPKVPSGLLACRGPQAVARSPALIPLPGNTPVLPWGQIAS